MGVLVDSNHSFADDQFRGAQQAAQRLGIQVVRVNVSSDQELEPAFATLAEQGAKALLGCASLLFQDNRNRIVALAERYNMPGAYEDRGFVTAGGLMSYGNNLVDDYRELGHYAGLILKGANAGELPVVRPTKFQLVINVRTAKKLGINISDNFLTLADEVIE